MGRICSVVSYQPVAASAHSGFRKSGSLAMLTAIRRASSRDGKFSIFDLGYL
jgi:hypothetical protein